MQLILAGLAITSALWGASLILDSNLLLNPKIPQPYLLSLIHIVSAILLLRKNTNLFGLVLLLLLTGYYVLFVKPLEPIAEPQTVGIVLITLSLVLSSVRFFKENGRYENVTGLPDFVFRLGLSYPFLEWGIDVVRNQERFEHFISHNYLASPLADVMGLDIIVRLLFLVEVGLAILLVSGFARNISGYSSIALLATFAVAAGYPLALPQNIALILASASYASQKDSHFTSS